jgi:hypothetical protein
MKQILWVLGLTLALSPLMGLAEAQAQARDSAQTRSRPSAALLMRLARARQLSTRPRSYVTQVGTAVAARRAEDAITRQKQTLDILSNQYLRGTPATTPSEDDIQLTIDVLEQQLDSPTPPENSYEITYYLAVCYESLGNPAKATELLQGIVSDYGSSEDAIVQDFVELARADLARLGA